MNDERIYQIAADAMGDFFDKFPKAEGSMLNAVFYATEKAVRKELVRPPRKVKPEINTAIITVVLIAGFAAVVASLQGWW